MNIMTKRGSQDNVITYEHYCDTKDDLTAIPNDQITLGSTAVVLEDEGDAMGVYMANSSKEWIPFSSVGNTGGGSDGGGSTGGVMIVNATSHYDEEHDETYYTADKSFDEVVSFIENGGIPILSDDDGNIAQCVKILRDESNIDGISFQRIFIDFTLGDSPIFVSRFNYNYSPEAPVPNIITYNEVSCGGSGGSDDSGSGGGVS